MRGFPKFPQSIALALIVPFVCALGWTEAPGAEAGPRPSVVRYLEYAKAVQAEILRDDLCPYAPAAVVMRIGSDPEALAAFVRERIAYEPYLGVQRGPGGTLAASAGSDWDRALLLRALLARAGFAARLRVLERTGEEAAAVVDAFLKEDPRRRTNSPQP